MEEARIVTSGSEVSARGDGAQHEAVLEHHHTLPSRSSALITWRPRCSGEAAVPQRGQAVVKEGRCFNAGTSVACNNRLANSVQTHFFDTGSAAAVGRQGRWTQRPSSGSPQGAEGGRWKTSTATAACIERARRAGEGAASRVVRSCAQGKRPTRGGESARTRWSCGGARPPNFQDRRCTGLFRAAGAREVGLCPDEIEHTGQQETAFWARWGAHRDRVDASA